MLFPKRPLPHQDNSKNSHCIHSHTSFRIDYLDTIDIDFGFQSIHPYILFCPKNAAINISYSEPKFTKCTNYIYVMCGI
jgi:hypothetical protein